MVSSIVDDEVTSMCLNIKMKNIQSESIRLNVRKSTEWKYTVRSWQVATWMDKAFYMLKNKSEMQFNTSLYWYAKRSTIFTFIHHLKTHSS